MRPNLKANLRALSGTLLLHVLFVYWLFSMTAPVTQHRKAIPALKVDLIRPPQPAPDIPHAPAVPSPPRTFVPTRKTPADRKTTMTAPPASEATADIPETKEADAGQPKAASADDLITNAKRNISKIDRDLQQAFPHAASQGAGHGQSALEKGIAGAAIPRSTTMRTTTLPDGRKSTRVSGPNGDYCVTTEASGGTDGIDHLQTGIRKRVTTCPQ